ncbi:MAG: tRNA glutamyl-Q(34) synthetase GluQRS [Burkholderiales bacterium]|nr:tRNA glutamyl-Q(34) synthetase GluQRS [Burkholderiales bacterium]
MTPSAIAYRGRFAPSPTGPLHFGSLVAALASYCDARAAGGQWLLRIEDVDTPRSRAGAEEAIVAALARCGFVWDGPILRQSQRQAIYADALERLRAAGAIFDCTCTRRDLESAPMGAAGERVYPGTCRDGLPQSLTTRSTRARCAQRLRVDSDVVTFVDLLQGPQRQDLASEVGDFVVRRSDGLFAYQLAVVVDDALQEISTVVRGADLLASTPRQILLQRRLQLPAPEYLHVPVAIGSTGEKLSKQTQARALPENPLPALLAAWRFLDQPMPEAAPATVADFLAFATRAWSRVRLPPVPMLPAPRGG